MSLHPQEIAPIPEETARVARLILPQGNRYLLLRDELGSIYTDELFVALYPKLGSFAEAPWRLALVTVMQFMENYTDRQAAEAVRTRIDWKYVLSLELTDPGFDFSVLSEFRSRLLEAQQEELLLKVLLEQCEQRGWLKARGKQRTDSTHVLAAIRNINRLECAGETLRAALNSLAVLAPDWLRAQVPTDWYDRYASRIEDYQMPKETRHSTSPGRANWNGWLASADRHRGQQCPSMGARNSSRRGATARVGAAVPIHRRQALLAKQRQHSSRLDPHFLSL